MNERERILDLVKKGILSSEEGLVLLENLATQSKTSASAATTSTPETDDDTTSAPNATSDDADETPEEDTKPTNPVIDELTSTRAAARTALDTVTDQLAATRRQIAANDEQIIVYDTMEDLDTLTPDKSEARLELQGENRELTQKATALEEDRNNKKQEFAEAERALRKAQVQSSIDKVLPDDWQNQAKTAATDLGKSVTEATSQIGSIVKKTVHTVMDNVDWKDITITVPGLSTQRLTHTFEFKETAATVLDVNVANGDVSFDTWDKDEIQVIAEIKLYGKTETDTLTAFTDRSRIEVNDDHFIFQVPNKRISADLKITLPAREYDHIRVRTLNGDLTLSGVAGKDFFVKTTNGQVALRQVNGVMVETENVNGDIKVLDSSINTVQVSTVNGDARFSGKSESVTASTVNGDVKLTLLAQRSNISATSVNGQVKVATPAGTNILGSAKARFGGIRSRMTGVESPRKSRHTLEINRPGEGSIALNLSTVTGDVLLKDTDVK